VSVANAGDWTQLQLLGVENADAGTILVPHLFADVHGVNLDINRFPLHALGLRGSDLNELTATAMDMTPIANQPQGHCP
jgi:hypothetical protein